jgi:hypothetical protein
MLLTLRKADNVLRRSRYFSEARILPEGELRRVGRPLCRVRPSTRASAASSWTIGPCPCASPYGRCCFVYRCPPEQCSPVMAACACAVKGLMASHRRRFPSPYRYACVRPCSPHHTPSGAVGLAVYDASGSHLSRGGSRSGWRCIGSGMCRRSCCLVRLARISSRTVSCRQRSGGWHCGACPRPINAPASARHISSWRVSAASHVCSSSRCSRWGSASSSTSALPRCK